MAVLYLVLAVLGGALAEGAVHIIITSLSFRFVRVEALSFYVDSVFNTFGSYPLSIYSTVVRVLLTYVLPLAFMAYVPATILLGKSGELRVPPLLALFAPAVGILWFTIALQFLHKELRHYQSTGH